MRPMSRCLLLTGSVLSGLVGAVGSAAAQNASSNQLETIVVTAMKRGEQVLQSVPSSIAVMGEDQLVKQGVVRFEDFARNVAGLSYLDNGPGDKRYTIRGINTAGEAQTALYYDNSSVTGVGGAATDFGGTQPDLELYDVQQIEVLRGPQSTLYGSNSQSGVIRVVTNKPELGAVKTSAELGTSSTEDGGWSYSIRGMTNIPVVEDRFAVRIVGYYDDSAGFVDNPRRNVKDYNDYRNAGLRASAKLQFSPDASLLGQVFYQDLETNGVALSRPFNATLPVPPIPGSPRPVNSFPADGERRNSMFTLTPRDDKTQIYALTYEHDLGWSDLTVAGSLFKRNIYHVEDYSTSFRFFEYLQANGAFPIFPIPAGGGLDAKDDADLWSIEARSNTKFDGPVNGVFGVYYSDRTINYINDVYTTNPATGRLDLSGIHVSSRKFKDQTEETALFGEVTGELTDKLSITGGIRWFENKRINDAETLVPFFGLGAPGVTPTRRSKNDGFIFKGLVSYEVTEDVLLFAQYAEGFRSGGTNASVAVAVPAQYEPDETVNYEVGVKTSWAEDRVVMNLTAYQIDLKDLQLGMTFGPGGAFSGIGNVTGKVARSRGFELDFTAKPTDQLTFVVTGSKMNAELTKSLTAFGLPQALNGAALIGVPDYTYSISGDYSVPLTGDVEASFGASLSRNGKVDVHRYDPYNLATRGYTLLNLRSNVAWDSYEVSLYVNNVADKHAQLNVYNDVNSPYVLVTNRPRTIGARLKAHW